jgi:hypothetical protein
MLWEKAPGDGRATDRLAALIDFQCVFAGIVFIFIKLFN